MILPPLHRRDLLAGAAAAMALAGIGPALLVGRGKMLVITEPADAASLAFARVLQRKGARRVDLRPDVVRCWRDDIAPPALSNGALSNGALSNGALSNGAFSNGALGKPVHVQLAGLTSWGNYLVVRGCAREAGLRVLHAQDASSPARHRIAWLVA